jgi:hypothetical protein
VIQPRAAALGVRIERRGEARDVGQPRAHQPGIGRIGQVQGAEQDDQVAHRRRLGGGGGGVQGTPASARDSRALTGSRRTGSSAQLGARKGSRALDRGIRRQAAECGAAPAHLVGGTAAWRSTRWRSAKQASGGPLPRAGCHALQSPSSLDDLAGAMVCQGGSDPSGRRSATTRPAEALASAKTTGAIQWPPSNRSAGTRSRSPRVAHITNVHHLDGRDRRVRAEAA